jgi:hypothetical protein
VRAWSWHTEEQEQGREVTAAGMLISYTLSRAFRLYCFFVMFSCCTACMFCKVINMCSASMCLRLLPSVEHCHACGCIALQVLSTDNAFIRVRKGVYTLRCWASQLPPQVDQGAAGASGGAKASNLCRHMCATTCSRGPSVALCWNARVLLVWPHTAQECFWWCCSQHVGR